MMKRFTLVFIFGFILSGTGMAQNTISREVLTNVGVVIYTNEIVDGTEQARDGGPTTLAGSCASPDGANQIIASPPPSYAWLQSNGYCHPAAYGTSGTVCWSMTCPANNTCTWDINSGWAGSGCVVYSFGPFTLYNSPACTVYGTGLTFTGVPAGNYVWCMGYSASGGGPGCAAGGFTDFCPYYQQTLVPLPIELLYFAGTYKEGVNILQWASATETNNDYYTIENSYDGIVWRELAWIDGGGNAVQPLRYTYKDYEFAPVMNYYRLKQTDFDGKFEYHGIIAIDNRSEDKMEINRTNLLGQPVDENYTGIIFIYYKDGTVVKQYNPGTKY